MTTPPHPLDTYRHPHLSPVQQLISERAIIDQVGRDRPSYTAPDLIPGILNPQVGKDDSVAAMPLRK